MVNFTGRLAAARRAATGPLLPLVAVPLFSSLLQVEKFRRALETRARIGVRFGFPVPVADAWTFVDLPNPPGLSVAGPVWLLPVLIVVQAALAAGYLGSIHAALTTGRYDFAADVREHFRPFLGYSLLTLGLGLATVSTATAGGAGGLAVLLVLAVPVVLALSYLFYAAPYLIVVRDTGLVPALSESYRLAVAGGAYLAFGGKYLLALVGLSLVGTAVVANLGTVGVLAGLLLGSVAGLTLNVATMQFVVDLVAEDGDPGEPRPRRDDPGRRPRVDDGGDGGPAGADA